MHNKTTVELENTSTMSVYQKLLKARVMFLERNVKKTGINRHLEFKYFELNDIVPPITEIGEILGLLFVTTFSKEVAKLTIINTDKPNETIEIESPMTEIDSKVSRTTGTEITNAIQNLGSVETYQRRYLYLNALDIVENDSLDKEIGEAPKKETDVITTLKKTTKKAPLTAIERTELKNEKVNADGAANEMQITALKSCLKKLKEVAPDKESFIQAIALKTKKFTVIKKKACEELILKISEMIEQYNPTIEEEDN